MFSFVTTSAPSQSFPLVTLSNAVPTNIPASQPTVPITNQVQPLIVMADIPISTAIENLSRLADINFLIDARVTKWWASPAGQGNNTHEPLLNFRWKNLTAKEALVRVLGEHHLVLADDPLTSIAWITYTNQVVNLGDAGLLGSDTNILPVTPVPLKNPVNIDDYRHRVMGNWAGVERVPVKWAFSQRA